jgi:DNA replication protein DnaC
MAEAWRPQQHQPEIVAWAFDDRLGLLLDAEWAARQQRPWSRRWREAPWRFPATPEEVDYHAPRQWNTGLIRQVCPGHWITQHQPVLITGPAGVGKSFLLSALAHAACRHGLRVRYYRLPRLLGEAQVAKQEGRWLVWLRGLSRWDLLLVDDWGFTTRTLADSQDLFEIVDDRYQARGLAIASQVPIDQWHALFPDPTLADAILDRLIHGTHRVVIQGESMRKVLSSSTERDTTNGTE